MRNAIACLILCLVAVASFGQNQTTAPKTLTMKVVSQLQISTSVLPAAVVGANYSAPLQSTGGVAPVKWSATGLPTWLALDVNTGVLSATPIPLTACTAPSPCSFTFTVTATDSTSQVSQLTVDGVTIASNGVLILDPAVFAALP